MSGDEFDNKHGDLLRDYNAPPPAPVDAMWHDIEVARSGKRPVRTVRPAWLRPAVYATAAAVVLALGIVIGQRGRNNRPVPVAPVATAPVVNSNTAYRIAALEHFTRAEAFLTRFEQQSAGTDTDAAVDQWAAQLLQDTRLLLDSPAAADPQVRALLGDLELVLAQLAQLKPDKSNERGLAAEGVRQQSVIERLRLLPSIFTATTGTPGV